MNSESVGLPFTRAGWNFQFFIRSRTQSTSLGVPDSSLRTSRTLPEALTLSFAINETGGATGKSGIFSGSLGITVGTGANCQPDDETIFTFASLNRTAANVIRARTGQCPVLTPSLTVTMRATSPVASARFQA